MCTTPHTACPNEFNSRLYPTKITATEESKGSETLSVMTPLLPVFPMSRRAMKIFFLFVLFLITSALHAQQPGVDCAPIQGQGWSGCAPINSPQQQQQSPAPRQPPERWQDHWGAIATYEPNGSLGAVTNMPSQRTAESAALEDCQSKHGSTCKIKLSYRNQCAAMIVGGKDYNVNPGSTVDKAIEDGMNTCRTYATDCHVYYSACSLPVRIQ